MLKDRKISASTPSPREATRVLFCSGVGFSATVTTNDATWQPGEFGCGRIVPRGDSAVVGLVLFYN